jgi:hypothetical protein
MHCYLFHVVIFLSVKDMGTKFIFTLSSLSLIFPFHGEQQTIAGRFIGLHLFAGEQNGAKCIDLLARSGT